MPPHCRAGRARAREREGARESKREKTQGGQARVSGRDIDGRLSSLISHPSSVPHLSSLISHPSSLIPHLSSLIPHLSSLICHPSSLIPHLSLIWGDGTSMDASGPHPSMRDERCGTAPQPLNRLVAERLSRGRLRPSSIVRDV